MDNFDDFDIEETEDLENEVERLHNLINSIKNPVPNYPKKYWKLLREEFMFWAS